MMKSRVDIIIPVYNVEPYLRRSLDSLIRQTAKCWRAICVDDGSSDGSSGILDEYAAMDDRFMVIHKANGGLSDARNCGMEVSSSEYLTFLDPDDFIHPQMVELALYFADRDKSEVVCWRTDFKYRARQIRRQKRTGSASINARPLNFYLRYVPSLTRSLVTDDLLGHCSDKGHSGLPFEVRHNYVWKSLYRREFIKDHKFPIGEYLEDAVWWGEMLLKVKKSTIIKLPLHYYYPAPGSIINASRPEWISLIVLRALEICYDSYRRNATERQMSHWSHHFKWVMTGRALWNIRDKVMNDNEIKSLLIRLKSKGFFEDAAGKTEEWICRSYLSAME